MTSPQAASLHSLRRFRRYAFLAAGLMASAGCVTEERPVNRQAGPPSGVRVGSPPRSAAQLPAGPVATPLAGATVNTSAQVEVIPLGVISYDGQVLPLVSPDGRFLAVEEGEAPSWQTLLATTSAAPPVRTKLKWFTIADDKLTAVEPPAALPLGLLLGRASDAHGFLVESPRPDGSRWIGRIGWIGGAVDWLVQGDDINSHAVITASGDLVFTRRTGSSPQCRLVLRASDGVESAWGDAGESWLFPVCTSEHDRVFALVESDDGLDLACVGVDRATGSPRLAGVLWRTHLFASFEPGVPYQMTAPTPQAWVGARRDDEPLLIFNPVRNRMMRVDSRSGEMFPLPARSVAAASSPLVGAPGWYCATPEGLVFSPASVPSQESGHNGDVPVVRVLGDAYVPRATTDAPRPFILIGPVRDDPKRLRIVAMRLPENAE
jgi:hypothetical protein